LEQNITNAQIKFYPTKHEYEHQKVLRRISDWVQKHLINNSDSKQDRQVMKEINLKCKLEDLIDQKMEVSYVLLYLNFQTIVF